MRARLLGVRGGSIVSVCLGCWESTAMESRISDNQYENVDPTPFVARIGDQSLPFASPSHPGWPLFFERIERDHNAFARVYERLEGFNEEHRQHLIGLIFDELMNQPENQLSSGAQHYMDSIWGPFDILVEGICLANPGVSREQVRAELGKLTLTQLRAVQIGPKTID